jgi:hypothetical protein
MPNFRRVLSVFLCLLFMSPWTFEKGFAQTVKIDKAEEGQQADGQKTEKLKQSLDKLSEALASPDDDKEPATSDVLVLIKQLQETATRLGEKDTDFVKLKTADDLLQKYISEKSGQHLSASLTGLIEKLFDHSQDIFRAQKPVEYAQSALTALSALLDKGYPGKNTEKAKVIESADELTDKLNLLNFNESASRYVTSINSALNLVTNDFYRGQTIKNYTGASRLSAALTNISLQIIQITENDESPTRGLFADNFIKTASALNSLIAADNDGKVSPGVESNRAALLLNEKDAEKLKALRNSLAFLDAANPVIAIRGAVYGRKDLVRAALFKKPILKPKAADQVCIATGEVLNKCHGRPDCTIEVVNSVCPTGDPAPLVDLHDKTLAIFYACVPGNAPHKLRYPPANPFTKNETTEASKPAIAAAGADDRTVDGAKNANIRSFDTRLLKLDNYWIEFAGDTASASLRCFAPTADEGGGN